MTTDKANKVYDVLVALGGAREEDRENFVYHHSEYKYNCTEWRFGGKLGFGGKYRSDNNRVDCYREDETPERREIIKKINSKLLEIKN